MNKKLFLGMFAAAGMLFATSCSNDELEAVQSGNEAQVTFSLGLEGGIATRAISDGTGAKKLVCAVYDADNEVIKTISINNQAVDATTGQFVNDKAFQGGLTDQINVTLAKGQTYTMVFWAQNGACDAYDTDDLKAVEIDYTNGAEGTAATGDFNNDETRDAFYAAETFKVEGNKEINVTLKRPFAQINVGVTSEDWNAAVASNITIEKSSVVIKNAATSINLLTGEVGNETTDVEVLYIENAIPQGEMLEVDTDGDGEKEEYHWLSMSYILVADHDETEDANGLLGTDKATLQGLQYTFIPESGEPIAFAEGLAGAPVQRNWRTNIIGKILTGDVQFNITIDPAYDGDYIYPNGQEQELEYAATFGGTVTLTDNVTLASPLVVTKDMILVLGDNTITGNSSDGQLKNRGVIEIDNGANVVIKGNEGGISTTSSYPIWVKNGTVSIEGGNYKGEYSSQAVYVTNGTAYIKGGKYEVDSKWYNADGSLNETDGFDANGNVKYLLNLYGSGNGEIIVTGGTFVKFDPSNNVAEGTNTNFVAEGYKVIESEGTYYVVANEIDAVADTENDLAQAFTNGENVILSSDVDATVPIKVNGNTLDGNGHTLSVPYAATSGWGQYALVMNNGGTIKNLAVEDAFRGIGASPLSGNITIDNVTIDNVTYAINGDGDGTNLVKVNNSTINGWISFSNIKLLSFNNCTLGKGNSYLAYLVVYGATTFSSCIFKDDFAMCANLGGKTGENVTFNNCIHGTTKVTADNFKTLFMAEDDETDFNKLKEFNVVVDGVKVVWD